MEIRDLFEEKVFTFSNLLTVLRIATVPFLIYHMHAESLTNKPEHRNLQLIFLFFIIATDFFDGFLARMFNQVSKLGQLLDPISDKICLIFLGSALVYFKDFPLWVLIVSIFREILVLFASFFLFTRKNVEVEPNYFGKMSVFFMAFAAFVYIIDIDYVLFSVVSLKEFSISMIILFYSIGSIFYVKKYSAICFTK